MLSKKGLTNNMITYDSERAPKARQDDLALRRLQETQRQIYSG